MQVTFYNFAKRVNSTKRPDTEGATINAVYLKDITNVNNPIITVTTDVTNMNYAKIGSTYFFISAIESMTRNVWRVTLTKDLLATYKDDVLSTNARVLYSSSNYNKDLLDERVRASGTYKFRMSETELTGFDEDGTYAITVISNNAIWTSGFATTYYLSRSEMGALTDLIFTENVWETIKQWWDKPLDAIVECYWLPIKVSDYLELGDAEIIIGEYETGIIGHPPVQNFTKLKMGISTLNWLNTHDDFRNLSPYTQFDLWIPWIGLTPLSANDFYNVNTMTLRYTVDIVTGNFQVEILGALGVVSSVSGNVKVSLPIGEAQSRISSFVSAGAGAVATVALAVSGHPAAAVTSGGYAVANVLTPRETINNDAYNGSIVGSAFPKTVKLWITTKDLDEEPENLQPICGRPCGKILRLSTLSGYVQTENASAQINALDTEIQAINRLLNGGVYLE